MAKLDLQQLFSAVEKSTDKIDHEHSKMREQIKSIKKKQGKNDV